MNVYGEIVELKRRLSELELKAHSPREFVRCEECNHKIKEKEDGSNNSIRNEDISNGGNVKKSTSSPRGLSSSKLKKQAGRQTMGSSKENLGEVSAKAKSKNK